LTILASSILRQDSAANAPPVLLLRAYIENSGADSLSGLEAQNTRLSLTLDDDTSALRRVTAYLSSDTPTPNRIWSIVEVVADHLLRLDRLNGSGVVDSNAHAAGPETRKDVWSAQHRGQKIAAEFAARAVMTERCKASASD
jgi:hypothetical protein